jgi:dephospho-CoA kinase
MIDKVFLLFYLIITAVFLILLSIILPRLTKNDKKRPLYIYVGYYVLNTGLLNYIFHFNPIKTILLNLIFLIFSNFIGSKLRVMGLTGQICSGKSTVSKYLRDKYKACVIDIDKLNREVLEIDEVKKEIRRNFGDDVFTNENELDRLKMRQIIYAEPNKKKLLERITHGRVFKLLFKTLLLEKLIYRNKYVFLENAILLRFNLFKYICFPIVSVCTTKKAEIIGRVMARDNCDRLTAERILDSQMKLEDYINQSDYVIFNDDDESALYKEVDSFLDKINV